MPRFSAGSASVSVVPDLSGFHRTLTAELGRINPNVTVQVRPDVTGFRQQLQAELSRASQNGIRIPVVLDLQAGALRGLQARLASQRLKATVDVDVDRNRMGAALAGAAKGLSSLGQVALGPLTSQVGLLTSGILAIGPAVASASGALALLPALGVAAAAPIATLAIGAQGLKDAFDAYGKSAKESAAASASSAAAAQAAAKQHEAAVKAVASAQRQVAAAGRQVTAAEQGVADAQRTSLRAQEELTRAREDAADRLEDLNLKLRASALDEEAAVLAVERARERLTATTEEGSQATALERKEADLGYRQALQSLDEVRAANADLTDETRKANAAGIEGSDGVRAAHERVTDAARGQADAQQTLGVAQENLVVQQQELTEAVADLYTAAAAAAPQTNSLADAMEKLSPLAQAFVTQIHALAPAWQELQFDVQDRLLRGLGDSITTLATTQLPVLRDGLGGLADLMNGAVRQSLDVFSSSGAARDFATTLAGVRGMFAPIMAAAAPLSQAFVDLATVGSGFLPAMGEGLGNLADRFSEWVAAARESGQLQGIIQGALDVLGQFGGVLQNVGSILMSVFAAADQVGGGFLGTLQQITGAMGDFLKSAAGQQLLTTVFAAFRDVVGALVQAVAPLLPIVGQLISTLLPPLVSVFRALAPIVGQVAAMLGTALVGALQMVAPVVPVLIGGFQQILGAMMPLLPPLLDLVVGLIPPLAGLIGALVPVVVAVVQAFLPLIPIITQLAASLIPPLAAVIASLLPFVAQLAQIIGAVLMQAFQSIAPLFPMLTDAFTRIIEAVLPLLPVLLNLAQQLMPSLLAVWLGGLPILMAIIPIITRIIEVLAPLVTQIAERLTPVILFFGRVFSDVMRGLESVVRQVVENFVGPVIGGLAGIFSGAVDGILWAWDRLKGVLAAPINFVIRTVLRDGLFTAWNWVLDKLGVESWHIDLGAPSLQGIPGYAAGGLIAGPWLGPAADNVLARLNPKEFVQPVAAVDRYGVGFMEAVRRGLFPEEVARYYGNLPGLASGGQLADVIKGQFPAARITSTLRPGARDYHGRGMAADIAGPTPSATGNLFMASVKAWIARVYGKGTSELIYDGADNTVADLRNGAPHAYSAATRAQHRNHVHWAMAGPLAGALGDISAAAKAERPWYEKLWGAAVGVAQSVTHAYDWLKNSIASVGQMAGRFGNGPLVGWLSDLPGSLVDAAWDNITDTVGGLFGAGETGGVLLRDSGGPLPPGMHAVYNGTGRTEWVLNPRDTAALIGAGRGGGGGAQYVNQITGVAPDPAALIAALTDAQRDLEFLRG